MSPAVVTLAGGVGAARLLRGLERVVDADHLTAVVNTGDDLELHGLHISPDLDTVVYTLAGAINPDTGWGLRDESWQAMTLLERYGGASWFGLGDRDLGTHLYRTARLHEGASLSDVTGEIARAWGLGVTIVPVTNDPIRTKVTLAEGPDRGTEVDFQEYFVHRRHDVAITGVRFAGADSCAPTPGVLDLIAGADLVVIAPSNPIVSIGPLLAVPGVRDAPVARRDATIAVSPIVAGAALKGPAARMLDELGHGASVEGVAGLYRDLAATLVIDEADRGSTDVVEQTGMHAVVTDTIMRDIDRSIELAATIVRHVS